MLYIKEEKNMLQQLSDAELEIMKIVWGNPDEVTMFPYIMDGLAARGEAMPEKYIDCPFVTADEQRLFECQKNWTAKRIYNAYFRNGVPDSANEEFSG